MMNCIDRPVWIVLLVFLGCAVDGTRAHAGPGTLAVVSHDPPAHVVTAAPNTAITVEFDRPVLPASFSPRRFWAMGRWSGPVRGSFTFSADNRTVTLTPQDWFSAGEQVTVYLSHDLQAADGSFLRAAGYSFQFWTRAGRASLQFDSIAVMTTRTTPGETSRAYGGIGSDLDDDGFLDITIVNEDTADLRVFLNAGDGTGAFAPFLQPTFPVGLQASPSEPSDFDRDGHVDICVANIAADTVSILLGRGDGRFNPQQLVTVGDSPRGIAVLDADGDGDVDIVNTNFGGTGSLSLLTNDGNGVFSAPTFFDGGANGERSLAAADMDDDGILDLVIGAWSPNVILVKPGNGDGTFSATPTSTPSGGGTWMLVCGDINGDGTEDVAGVNSSQNQGAILLGDGTGQLAAPASHPVAGFPIATDLADLDGDGDLDWITSSFGGDWLTFVNDGSGTFAFDQTFVAPIAASCSLPMDIDNDGDLDLALIDELEDVVIVLEQQSLPCAADLNGSSDVGFADLLTLLAQWGPCPACPGDLDQNGTVGFSDVLALIGDWGPC